MTFEILPAATFTKDQIAVALAHGMLDGGHLGIGFHSAKEGLKVVHLAWHKKLRVDAVPGDLSLCWVCTTVDLPPSASKQAVGIVRAVASRLPHISYGINLIAAKGSFSARGEYRPPKGSDGLTCATFVVEVLRAAAIPLVKSETWREDAKNIDWGNTVCNELAKRNAPQDHIDAVRKNISGLRMRPYEVAGAANMPRANRPADFDSVQPEANGAEAFLQNYCPR